MLARKTKAIAKVLPMTNISCQFHYHKSIPYSFIPIGLFWLFVDMFMHSLIQQILTEHLAQVSLSSPVNSTCPQKKPIILINKKLLDSVV